MDQTSIETALTRIAFEQSEAFCYGCYIPVKRAANGSTHCPRCLSDDCMRLYKDEGPEWGLTHVIDRLLTDNCEEISENDLTERFEVMLDECYPEIKICGLTYNQGEAFKRLDPVAFDLAANAYVDQEIGETLITFDNGSTYFDKQSVEDFVAKN